jgi:hypothetical protein
MRRVLQLLVGATILSVLAAVATDDDGSVQTDMSAGIEPSETPYQPAVPKGAPAAVAVTQDEPDPVVAIDEGPFAPRPPGYVARNLSYGATAPLASGQDVSGQRSGLPPVDLSD